MHHLFNLSLPYLNLVHPEGHILSHLVHLSHVTIIILVSPDITGVSPCLSTQHGTEHHGALHWGGADGGLGPDAGRHLGLRVHCVCHCQARGDHTWLYNE